MKLLEDAIRDRSVVQFEYGDAVRFVEPHCLGRGSKGQLLLRGFQTGGASDTLNFGWKLFTVEKIVNARLAPPRPGYVSPDSAMAGGTIAELATDGD